MRKGRSLNLRWQAYALSLVFTAYASSPQGDIGSTFDPQSLIENSAPAPIPAIVEAASVWTTDAGLTRNALHLLAHIKRADSEGLDTDRYHFDALVELTDQQWHAGLRRPYDELMATAFKQLVTDLGQGVVTPKTAQSAWFQDVQPVDTDSAYLALKLPGNSVETVLNQYRPKHPSYLKLAEKLVEYRDIQQQGGWPRVPPTIVLKPGMTNYTIAVLRNRLQITGDMPTRALPENRKTYTEDLVQAVKRFQQRHGLVADGIIGKNTFDALNVSVDERIDTIKLNLERLRWLPRNLGERYVFTNIADFRLQVVEHDKEILEMPVVVGKEKFKTPVFSDEIEWIVLNPTWTVPRSIMYRELIPKELKNPGYLQRKNFELFREENGVIVIREPNSLTREEYAAHPFRYTMRQKTGKNNALGQTKFIFPNKHSIYLHDTPSKSLFRRNKRAFSHGCIRVADPETLTETLLGFQGVTPKRIKQLRKLKKAKTITLKDHIPNHIVYLTSWVDGNNTIQFRKDLYDHDDGLIQALEEPHKQVWPASILAILEED